MSAEMLNLLLVGTTLASRVNIKELLAKAGIVGGSLRAARSVRQAVSLLEGHRCDAVLYALKAPGLARFDAIASLNLAAPEIPILVIADSDDLLVARLALRAGADDCLVASALNGPQLIRAVHLASERRQKLAQLTAQAWRDALTGLPNRALLQDRLSHMVLRARRYGASIGILFIDLDRFKLVNDNIGHAGGDQLLCALATRLRDTVRRSDTVARLGGDEFVVALENLSRREDAEEIAAVIEARIAEPFRIGGQWLSVSASIGIAMFGPEADNVDALLRHADSAMYLVKRAKPARL